MCSRTSKLLSVSSAHDSPAARLGVPALGTMGLIALAKKRGVIAAARPLIAQVRAEGGLWVTDKLVAEVLARIGE